MIKIKHIKTKTDIQNLTLTVQIFREGKYFISYNPELKVASCGKSIDEAKEKLKEAISGFLQAAKKINTYQRTIYREPVQFTGFKLFYKNDLREPNSRMMTPLEVLKLKPQPVFIQYQ